MLYNIRIRSLVFALLLVASNLVFAGHVSAHLYSPPAGCDWCVCQERPVSAPLPADPGVVVEAGQVLTPDGPLPLPVACARVVNKRSRAPPVSP
ncbi:hypothetical protein [Elongatibacter sediminis]|uniref:Uncharacterized protein n=1 Tax=Elongatibacter sediminis TaxID=3119006 RepID=A0AAW9RDF4_9GAMM